MLRLAAMAGSFQVDAEAVYGHDGGGGARLGGASEDVFEAIGQHGDKERCGRPHAGRQNGLNRGAALGAGSRLRQQLLLR